MSENQPDWAIWRRTLRRWGMAETAASLLESAGSMSLLLANLIYLGQPLISGAVSTGSLQSIAQVLENPFERQAFATFLRESSTSGTAT